MTDTSHDTSHDRPFAVVTGGTRGIGAAICERLLADGWAVLATYASDAASAGAFAAHHDGLAVLRADTASEADCRATIEAAVSTFGHLDHLVVCAAITGGTVVADLTDNVWDTILATNLTGAMRMTRAALPQLTASARGRVVYVSSVAAVMGPHADAAYAASKAGLLGLARSLAREVAEHGTTVNIVLPGPTADTGMTAGTDPAFVQAIARRIPMKRLGRSEETAHAVRFLLDDLASFTTGSMVFVDGGLSM